MADSTTTEPLNTSNDRPSRSEMAIQINEMARIIQAKNSELNRLRQFVEALVIGDPLALSDVRGYALHALTGEPHIPEASSHG